MRARTRTTVLAAAASLVVLGVVGGPAQAASTATYRVTITALIPGQPLTPPVVATHTRAITVFRIGTPASFEVKEIAENGNTGPLASALDAETGVADVFSGSAPLVAPGVPGASSFPDTVTFTLQTGLGARFLSWESMLICTNDGFTGVSGLRLPPLVGTPVTLGTLGRRDPSPRGHRGHRGSRPVDPRLGHGRARRDNHRGASGLRGAGRPRLHGRCAPRDGVRGLKRGPESEKDSGPPVQSMRYRFRMSRRIASRQRPPC